MATITVQKASLAGTDLNYVTAAGGGDQFDNDGRTILHVRNGGGASINVTIASPAACDQGGSHPVIVAVPNADDKFIGPFRKARHDDANGRVQITYSAVTSVTVAAISDNV